MDGDDSLKGRPEPILVSVIGDLCTYRWPDTGEEFYGTRYIPIVPRYPDHDDVELVFVLNLDQPAHQQLESCSYVYKIDRLPKS